MAALLRLIIVAIALAALGCSPAASASASGDPLPSWKETAPKKAIVAFVANVTRQRSPEFVPIPERIATFDNDGTLWAEKPVPFQLLFAFDRVKALAPQHPEWKSKEPFASLLQGDMQGVAAAGEKGLMELVAAFIVSGGGVEFMRAFAEHVYGVPPEQVIGSTGKLQLEKRDGKPVLVKLAAVELIDDKDGKPVAIQSRIGRRPIAAFGNSDGDLPMLEWTAAGDGARFALLVHHDDGKREFAYDRADKLQKLDAAWNAALARHWTVVSMRNDWATIFPRQR